eukprot:6480398-Amphidinium_carterae.2
MRRTLTHVLSRAYLDACRIACCTYTKDSVGLQSEDSAIVDGSWSVAVAVAGNLGKTVAMWRTPPFAFLGLLTDNEAERADLLRSFAVEWRNLQQIEAEAWENKRCSVWHQRLLSGDQAFVRETFVMLSELKFEGVSVELKGRLMDFARSHHSTLIAELFFNSARRIAIRNFPPKERR